MLRFRQLFRTSTRPRFYTGPKTITALPTVRHVRFRRPWMRTFIGKFLLYGVAFHLWSSFVLIRFDDDTNDADSSEKTPDENTLQAPAIRDQSVVGEEEEEDDDDAPLFIPLTWCQVHEADFYTASDPEWQEFAKISKDREKMNKLRDELAGIILKTASEQMNPFLGGPMSLTGLWLVAQFPNRPPPGYARSGIELTDDGVSWVTRPMDPEMGDKLQTYMKPVHVALAIKDAYYVLLKRQLDRLRNPNGQPNAVELLDGRFTLSSHRDEITNPINIRERPELQQQPPVSEDGSSGPTESIPSSSSNDEPKLHPSTIISSLQRLPLPDLGPGSDFHLASIAFKLRLHDHQAQTPRTPHRGSFFFSGPVGVKGPNGSCRFEVVGEYDPAKPGWRNVDIKLKDLNYHKQRPRGR